MQIFYIFPIINSPSPISAFVSTTSINKLLVQEETAKWGRRDQAKILSIFVGGGIVLLFIEIYTD